MFDEYDGAGINLGVSAERREPNCGDDIER